MGIDFALNYYEDAYIMKQNSAHFLNMWSNIFEDKRDCVYWNVGSQDYDAEQG